MFDGYRLGPRALDRGRRQFPLVNSPARAGWQNGFREECGPSQSSVEVDPGGGAGGRRRPKPMRIRGPRIKRRPHGPGHFSRRCDAHCEGGEGPAAKPDGGGGADGGPGSRSRRGQSGISGPGTGHDARTIALSTHQKGPETRGGRRPGLHTDPHPVGARDVEKQAWGKSGPGGRARAGTGGADSFAG